MATSPRAGIRSTLIPRVLQAALRLTIVFVLAFSPFAQAAKIQLAQDVHVRDVENRKIQSAGVLAKGSVVEIPDDFLLPKNGPPDFEASLNNWLSQAGYLKSSSLKNGTHADFFFPVRVYYAAPGSQVGRNEEIFVPFKNLAMRENRLVVVKTVRVVPRKTFERQTGKASRESVPPMESDFSCPGGCSTPTDDAFMSFGQDLRKAFMAVNARKSKSDWDLGDLRGVKKTFERTCGMKFNSFISHLNTLARQEGVPSEVLLGIMTRESSGDCRVVGDEGRSRGLFQAGGASFDPIRNLKSAVKLIKSMRKTLFRDGVRLDNGTRVAPFNLSEMSAADSWRLTLASYNGGPGWVFEAKYDLQRFSQRYGVQLTADNYEHLRPFFLRRWLNRYDEKQYFGVARSGRSAENAVKNLTYIETILGRSVQTSGNRAPLARLWKQALQSE